MNSTPLAEESMGAKFVRPSIFPGNICFIFAMERLSFEQLGLGPPPKKNPGYVPDSSYTTMYHKYVSSLTRCLLHIKRVCNLSFGITFCSSR